MSQRPGDPSGEDDRQDGPGHDRRHHSDHDDEAERGVEHPAGGIGALAVLDHQVGERLAADDGHPRARMATPTRVVAKAAAAIRTATPPAQLGRRISPVPPAGSRRPGSRRRGR